MDHIFNSQLSHDEITLRKSKLELSQAALIASQSLLSFRAIRELNVSEASQVVDKLTKRQQSLTAFGCIWVESPVQEMTQQAQSKVSKPIFC